MGQGRKPRPCPHPCAIGIEHIIDPEASAGLLIANKLHNPGLRDVIRLGDTNHVAHIRVPVGALGRRVVDLNLRKYGLTCLGVIRGTDLMPDGYAEAELSVEDGLLIFGKREKLQAFTTSG